MTRIFLVGGGHAHLIVMEELAKKRRDDLEVVMATPSPWQYYSGMLPGLISGRYAEDDCRIDIRPLAAKAGVRLILEPVAAIDADRNMVCFADGRDVGYDLMSLDIGSEINAGWLASLSDKLLLPKPIDGFVAQWHQLLDRAKAEAQVRLVVVGGGAAGVELALATKRALDSASVTAEVFLIAGRSSVLSSHGARARRLATHALARSGIMVIQERAAGSANGVHLSNGQTLDADYVIAATGARPASWLELSRLSLDEHGFVLVDAAHRSASHPNVFAVGDVAARSDVTMEKSGVHAVRAGPVLARNLIAASKGESLQPYFPRKRSLYILASGPGTAIASWGALSAEGRWAWRWKDRIDRNFINRLKV